MEGFVKLGREVEEWEHFKDPNCMLVLIYLIIHAKYTDGEFQGYALHPSDVVYSIKGISNSTGLSDRQVRTALGKLKATGILTSISTSKFSVGSLGKWASQKPTRKKATSTSTSKTTTYEEYKEEKREFGKGGIRFHV